MSEEKFNIEDLMVHTPTTRVVKNLAIPSSGIEAGEDGKVNITKEDLNTSYSDTDTGINIPTFTVFDPPRDPITIISDLNEKKPTTEKEYNVAMQRKWRFQPLYKHNANGALIMWYVAYNIDTGSLEITHGHVGGKLQIDIVEVKTNKSGRTQHQQSLVEASSRYQTKYSKNYYRPPGVKAPAFKDAMLAKKYVFGMEKGNTKLSFPVITQPKLDGVRSLCTLEGTKLRFRSRSNKSQPHLIVEMEEEIMPFITSFPYANLELDGEMFIPNMNFSDFSSIIRNEKTPHSKLKNVVYNIYDYNCGEPVVMEERIRILNAAFASLVKNGITPVRFKIVDSHMANNHEEIIRNHQYYLSQGYEGTMIRKIAGPNPTQTKINSSVYKAGRGNNLLKHKDFMDQEGFILRVEDGDGRDSKAAIPVIECIHKDENGKTITTNIRMKPKVTMKKRKEWFANPELIVGKLATYTFQEVTKDGRPRFPVMIAVRDYE